MGTSPTNRKDTGITWRQWIDQHKLTQLLYPDQDIDPQLGALPWLPNDQDSTAAWEYLIELRSRIATQPLPLRSGNEESALDSLFHLFELFRDAAKKHKQSVHFTTLTLRLLNLVVRPFTARWHRQKAEGRLVSVDVRIQFRAELQHLQEKLREGARMLAAIAKVPYASVQTEYGQINPDLSFIDQSLTLGDLPEGQDSLPWKDIYSCELDDIRARRGLADDAPVCDGVGLALSGGGIRSATFSLGVVSVLARKGILRQVDYLSTVSGGGYFGSFLTSMLGNAEPSPSTIEEVFGKAGAAETIGPRALRNHSKYLVEGGIRTIASLIGLVMFGLATTLLLIAPLLLGLAALLGWLAEQISIEGILITGVVVMASGYLSTSISQKRRWEQIETASIFLGLSGFVAVALVLALSAGFGTVANSKALTSWFSIALIVVATGMLIPTISKSMRFVFGILVTVFLFALAWSVVTMLLEYRADALFLPIILLVAGSLYVLTSLCIDLNAASPHRFYRKRLASTYLLKLVGDRVEPNAGLKLSDLNLSGKAPYHLICAAVNIPGSTNAQLRDRRTDFFFFSKHYCGSPSSGLHPTANWEKVDRNLDVATAMAISGAAAAPNMGTSDASRFRYLLGMLNLRLSYWLRRPDGAENSKLWPSKYFWHELRGSMSPSLPFLNVSDGGHIENLGIYELLRRRCKFIIAVDGEADPQRAFGGLLTLVHLARIDLGVDIDPDLTDLRVDEQGVGRSHFEQFRIGYPGGGTGVLLYIKASMTGNESEYLLRYRAENPDFPHESTAKQLFSEQQFEAYRYLGEHIAGDLFREDLVGCWAGDESVKEWMKRLGKHLLA